MPQKYWLSAKACTGILNRAKRRGKTLPPALKEALERQSACRAMESTELKQLDAMGEDGVKMSPTR